MKVRLKRGGFGDLKRKNIIKLSLWILFVLLTVYVAFSGLVINNSVLLESAGLARQDINLRGGIKASLFAERYADKSDVSIEDSDLEAAMTLVEFRLSVMGINDRKVTPDFTNKRVDIEIPYTYAPTELDHITLIEKLSAKSALTFAAIETDDDGRTVQSGETLIYGENLISSEWVQIEGTNGFVIELEFDSIGKQALKDATTKLKNEKMGIFIDGISAFYDNGDYSYEVTDIITSGKLVLKYSSNGFPYTNAWIAANRIKSGFLPFELTVNKGQLSVITPATGVNVFKAALPAGVVVIILIIIFMILCYKLKGVVAGFALITYIALVTLFLSWFQIPITLPGVIGIIISIGLSIDANVIVFERIKEEGSKDDDITSVIRKSFNKSFRAIIDSKLVMILAAIVLYYFGTAEVKGFAYTLILGIALSFITAVWMTRSMLLTISDLGILKSPVSDKAGKSKKEGGTV